MAADVQKLFDARAKAKEKLLQTQLNRLNSNEQLKKKCLEERYCVKSKEEFR